MVAAVARPLRLLTTRTSALLCCRCCKQAACFSYQSTQLQYHRQQQQPLPALLLKQQCRQRTAVLAAIPTAALLCKTYKVLLPVVAAVAVAAAALAAGRLQRDSHFTEHVFRDSDSGKAGLPYRTEQHPRSVGLHLSFTYAFWGALRQPSVLIPSYYSGQLWRCSCHSTSSHGSVAAQALHLLFKSALSSLALSAAERLAAGSEFTLWCSVWHKTTAPMYHSHTCASSNIHSSYNA
jgi:hypothetical protein